MPLGFFGEDGGDTAGRQRAGQYGTQECALLTRYDCLLAQIPAGTKIAARAQVSFMDNPVNDPNPTTRVRKRGSRSPKTPRIVISDLPQCPPVSQAEITLVVAALNPIISIRQLAHRSLGRDSCQAAGPTQTADLAGYVVDRGPLAARLPLGMSADGGPFGSAGTAGRGRDTWVAGLRSDTGQDLTAQAYRAFAVASIRAPQEGDLNAAEPEMIKSCFDPRPAGEATL